jgi:lysophospholipase L1-like esterase
MKFFIPFVVTFCLLFSCNSDDTYIPNSYGITTNGATIEDPNTTNTNPDNTNTNDTESPPQEYKILALGDSYTIGQSVCETCRFPAQLKDSLTNNIINSSFELDIIAQTGWSTTVLKSAIIDANPNNNYDLVTLLIGVNNQYQNRPFSVYETEFPELLNIAIDLAKGDKNKVIVISIPDYAYTPFGQNLYNSNEISTEIDQYNAYAQSQCILKNVTYVYITDITREGLENTNLVASDNLHPSELAYSKFVERLLPLCIEKLQ